MIENIHENQMFWKKVQRIRKEISENEERVKTEDGTMLVQKKAVKKK